jgi:hypothetical protein
MNGLPIYFDCYISSSSLRFYLSYFFLAALGQCRSMISASSSPLVLLKDDKNSGEDNEAISALITIKCDKNISNQKNKQTNK